MLLWLRIWIDLQFVFDYFSADPYQVGGGPSKNFTVLVQELQQLHLLMWAYLSSDAHSLDWYSWVER
jgi:hypothetical protein